MFYAVLKRKNSFKLAINCFICFFLLRKFWYKFSLSFQQTLHKVWIHSTVREKSIFSAWHFCNCFTLFWLHASSQLTVWICFHHKRVEAYFFSKVLKVKFSILLNSKLLYFGTVFYSISANLFIIFSLSQSILINIVSLNSLILEHARRKWKKDEIFRC